MDAEDIKFRIKIVELSDGTRMYHPQVYMIIKHFKRILFFNIYKPVYAWRGFCHTSGGKLIPCTDESDGNGSSEMEYAREQILKFKEQLQKNTQALIETPEEKAKKAIKQITYIDVPNIFS